VHVGVALGSEADGFSFDGHVSISQPAIDAP